MTPTLDPPRDARQGMPAHALRHPLMAAARDEALSAANLSVTQGASPLPLLLLRAEFLSAQTRDATRTPIRIGLLVDARGQPGRRHALRGALLLRVDLEGRNILEAETIGLEWRDSIAERWSRAQSVAGAAMPRFSGRAGRVAEDVAAWALTPRAHPAIRAALRAGAAALERSAMGFESDATLHELDSGRADAVPGHRQRGLAWAARQRGMAAQQRRQAVSMQQLAANLAAPLDIEAETALLDAAAVAAARHDARRAKADAASQRAAARRAEARATRIRDLAAEERLQKAGPALRAALQDLLAALESAGGIESALDQARQALSAAQPSGSRVGRDES